MQKVSTGSSTTITDYAKGIQYTNGSIDLIQTKDGIAIPSCSSYVYHYHLKDHLGNTWASIYYNTTISAIEAIQRDDNYPFGLRVSTWTGSHVNKYLYNGKELQDELRQYEYGARFNMLKN